MSAAAVLTTTTNLSPIRVDKIPKTVMSITTAHTGKLLLCKTESAEILGAAQVCKFVERVKK
jgi:hypothetical protein